jgi:hypothetical protein
LPPDLDSHVPLPTNKAESYIYIYTKDIRAAGRVLGWKIKRWQIQAGNGGIFAEFGNIMWICNGRFGGLKIGVF